jgi:hypothetical protein
MKSELQEQYTAIRSNIQSNVQTIGSLIRQAHNLRNIVMNLSGTPETEAIKKQLEEEIENIEQTINTLIKQTDALFESYNKFVSTLSN